jgi:phospholipase D3/4
MASWWNHSKVDMKKFLRSLSAINSTGNYNHLGKAEVRLFVVPSYNKRQQNIPYARVNHNKYMVTDNAAFIGEAKFILEKAKMRYHVVGCHSTYRCHFT